MQTSIYYFNNVMSIVLFKCQDYHNKLQTYTNLQEISQGFIIQT
jgi:hypothetical protein